MDEELRRLGNMIGLPEPIRMPVKRARGDFRDDRRNYREVLSDEDRKVVETVCEREIRAFGYCW